MTLANQQAPPGHLSPLWIVSHELDSWVFALPSLQSTKEGLWVQSRMLPSHCAHSFPEAFWVVSSMPTTYTCESRI